MGHTPEVTVRQPYPGGPIERIAWGSTCPEPLPRAADTLEHHSPVSGCGPSILGELGGDTVLDLLHHGIGLDAIDGLQGLGPVPVEFDSLLHTLLPVPLRGPAVLDLLDLLRLGLLR